LVGSRTGSRDLLKAYWQWFCFLFLTVSPGAASGPSLYLQGAEFGVSWGSPFRCVSGLPGLSVQFGLSGFQAE
jgi:hypothetical protein